ncbi:MAG: ABC transporter ATP-binding protein [Methanoculleus horonobensis]|nr:ABC transporter ATP-binding protein [Methanoculleus horonobensis]MDD4251526.1 ABC transporter ATP-binding protein [Methanoculleus horonobensis]
MSLAAIHTELKYALSVGRDALYRRCSATGTFRHRDLLFFAGYLRPVAGLGALSLTLLLAATALRAVVPLSGKILVDNILLGSGPENLEASLQALHLGSLAPVADLAAGSVTGLIAALCGVVIAIGAIGFVQRYVAIRFQQELSFRLHTSLFDHVLRFPLSYFKKHPTGYVMARVSDDVDAVQALFAQLTFQVFANAALLVISLTILFMLNPGLTIVIAGLCPVYVIANLLFRKRVYAKAYTEREATADVKRGLQEVIAGIDLVKSFSSEEREVERFSGRLRSVFDLRLQQSILQTTSGSSVSGLYFLGSLVVLWFGVEQVLHGSMTIGDFVAFFAYASMISGVTITLFTLPAAIQPAIASANRVRELFSMAPEDGVGCDRSAPRRLPGIAGRLAFSGVSFSYDSEKPVLRDVSFTVNPGETIAIRGLSGGGKTTLINLILGYYTPQSGEITIDGTSLAALDLHWLRSNIAAVAQETFLFNDTVGNNIRYGNPDASHAEVVRAAKLAHIDDAISRLPAGYDTIVGERGAHLSEGQCQRIAIARAFLKDAPVLILDEPTSALDEETEVRICESLRLLARSRTTIITSHRTPLLATANRVYHLEDGRLVPDEDVTAGAEGFRDRG